MEHLIGDRFFLDRRARTDAAIDLASGEPVGLRVAPAGDRSSQLIWNDRAAELARLRHPLLNTLVDFGLIGRDRTFEAYALAPLTGVTSTPRQTTLAHLGRFLESRGVQLTPDLSHVAVREAVAGAPRRRLLGVILQARAALTAIEEALDAAPDGGTGSIDVAGASGSGLRTIRMATARAARLAGYVPVCTSALLQRPDIAASLNERHLCVLLDDRPSGAERLTIATFLARLGTDSPRRHVVIRFLRAEVAPRGAVALEPMRVSDLTAMVFVDPDRGPDREEIAAAARDADGRPGVFLERLRAARFGDRLVGIGAVHESSAAYRVEMPTPRPSGTAPVAGRALGDAPARAERLASRGRHAAAIRLLTRVSRVLEARGDAGPASQCATTLAWIERGRGRSHRALENFERARSLAGTSAVEGVVAAVGIGIVWTDELRLAEADAALRATCAAAAVLRNPELRDRASTALARCLFWQGRLDEAGALLALDATGDARPEILNLHARIRVAAGDFRGAVNAANQAILAADRAGSAAGRARASRTMAIVQEALGDVAQVREWVARGVGLASSAHLPILGLRLRAILVRASHSAVVAGRSDGRIDDVKRVAGHLRAALKQRPLPALVRSELERACSTVVAAAAAHEAAPGRSLRDLQELLEVSQAAQDDQAALAVICDAIADRLRAASVQIATGGKEPRTLARSGRPWAGDSRIVDDVLTAGVATSSPSGAEPRCAAEPIRFGRQTIAVLCCRWTAGATLDRERCEALLRAGALAAATPARSLLDRAHAPLPDAARGEIIGESPPAVALREAVARAARAPFPVLIEGESGSGKELVARSIHRCSARKERRLCTVNCAALADDLLEAELFGHARGAFTGAIGERSGLFEEADGGTLFLDEVGELSPRAQAKLLRVLQDGEVRRVGENLPRRVDARIVAATNRRLDEEGRAGRFREDLRFRLDVVRLVVPPLRERATDIPALALHFWNDAASRVGSSATLSPEALAALARHDWPGNVRELQNAIASLAVHAPRRGRIGPALLPAHIARSMAAKADTFEAARHEFERRFVRAALAQAGGHRARAARALGVSRQGLAKILRRLQIDDGAK
jgi:DNA-binding NtrC family response regulator